MIHIFFVSIVSYLYVHVHGSCSGLIASVGYERASVSSSYRLRVLAMMWFPLGLIFSSYWCLI